MVGISCVRMPKECMTNDGANNGCPIDKMWCAQRHAPKEYTISQILQDRTGKIPSWCPLLDLTRYMSMDLTMWEDDRK